MMDLDTRWIQRFNNFGRACLVLEKAMHIESPSVIEQAGIIQFFEMTFELAWKLLRDYEEAEGFIVSFPREAIKYAFQTELVSDGHAWIEALGDQTLTLRAYEASVSLNLVKKIKEKYFPLFQALRETFQENLKILEREKQTLGFSK